MTELDGALVRRKLNSIVRNLRDLGDIENLSLAEYRGDRFRQKGTERQQFGDYVGAVEQWLDGRGV